MLCNSASGGIMNNMTVLELVEGIKARKFTACDVVKHYIEVVEKSKDYNAVIEVFSDALDRAKAIDEKIANGEEVGKLAGVPVAIADNIVIEGKKASAASNFLADFVSPYSATVVKKLLAEDAIPFIRTNMDEFAVGSSSEYSLYGAVKNAVDSSRVAGGCQGGAAVAVALDMCPVAIASDTGGSLREPASFNGVVAIKPSTGTVSRFGLIASSFDQIAPITKNVSDNEYVLKVIAGKDYHDGISINNKFEAKELPATIKLGLIKEALTDEKFSNVVDSLKAEGVEFVEVSVPHFDKALACYYIIASAVTTSNLAKFDGIKSSRRSNNITDLESVYVNSRSEGFGIEAKRRIILGNFVLSGENLPAYYNQARKVQNIITSEFVSALNECDAIMMPTTLGEAFKLGEKVNDPVAMYKEDLFTVPASITGLPAITVPVAVEGLPIGVQFCGAMLEEDKLYKIAQKFEDLQRRAK